MRTTNLNFFYKLLCLKKWSFHSTRIAKQPSRDLATHFERSQKTLPISRGDPVDMPARYFSIARTREFAIWFFHVQLESMCSFLNKSYQ